MKHPALSALTEAELAVFDLPPLTEAELAVLEPRYGDHVGLHTPTLDDFTLAQGVKHTCAELGTMPCPACVAVEEEMARRAKIVK